MVVDKRVVRDALGPMRAPQQEVVHRFADLAGIDEQAAEPKVLALLRQRSMLHMPWRETGFIDAATAALVRFYLEGGTEDELLRETQRAWDSLESEPRTRLRKQRRLTAQERYLSSWARWKAARED